MTLSIIGSTGDVKMSAVVVVVGSLLTHHHPPVRSDQIRQKLGIIIIIIIIIYFINRIIIYEKKIGLSEQRQRGRFISNHIIKMRARFPTSHQSTLLSFTIQSHPPSPSLRPAIYFSPFNSFVKGKVR